MTDQLNMLVIGSCGFIAQHLIANLLQGHNVIYAIQNNPVSINDEIKILNINLLDQGECKQLVQFHFDYVFNLAGNISHDRYFEGGQRVFDQHFTLVRNLVDCLDWSTIKGFVQVGSSDEYGSHPSPQNESMRERSFSPYSCGKTLSTHFLQMLARSESLPISIARLFLVYGSHQKNNRFLPRIIHACLQNKTLDTSPGEQERDFLHVTDVVRALIMMAQSEHTKGEVYNIASGKPISIQSVIQKVIQKIGQGAANFGALPYRSGENMSLYADITKACRDFGWSPSIPFDEGLGRTIDWYQSNLHSFETHSQKEYT